jgi:predicted transcriptional regulator
VGNLADGSSATCAELDALIAVDREAIQFEKNDIDALEDIESEKSYMIDALFGNDKDKVEATKNRLKKQISKLKKIRKDKVCETSGANLRQATDYEVYKRADEDVLNTARVVERAKAGKLVDGSGATCSELEKIIGVDKKAVAFEKDKLEAMGETMGVSEADKKVVADAEKAIEVQIVKLEALRTNKGCELTLR